MNSRQSLPYTMWLCVLLAAAACAARAADAPVLAGVVVGVVDGDTADVRLASGTVRIRLHAIDAPEMGQPYGKAAKTMLSDLVYGRTVDVEPYEQDRFDRLVARLWLGTVDVNAELLKSGHAWTYRRYADDAGYCAFEKSARDLRRGLWQAPPGERIAPWEWRQRKSRAGQFTDYDDESVTACVAALGRR